MTHDLMSVRTLNVTGLSLRTTGDGDGRTIDGIAVPFGKEYELFDGYAETIDPDCDFGGRDVKLAREHGELIGKVTGLDRQADGLHITARLSDTQAAREAAQLIDDGVYDAFSIGFAPNATSSRIATTAPPSCTAPRSNCTKCR
jgi:phage head maturation protease